ncbi:MAG: phosphatase PAP2 family protein [Candidatus Omnitrophica bacterium]|nr:phosphatase PAP2 family protein [Candidatus Omnitrophota bacterium]
MNFKKYFVLGLFKIQILLFIFAIKFHSLYSEMFLNDKKIFENFAFHNFCLYAEINKEKFENYQISVKSGSNSFKEKIKKWNEVLFLFINKFAKKSKILDAVFIFLSSFGKEYILIPLVGSIIYFKKRNELKKLFLIFILSLFLGEIIVHILKIVISFPRPFIYFDEKSINVLEKPITKYSFPSGHAQVVFTGALFLSWILPKWKILFLLFSIFSGFSRCYIGVHFPFDVIGGFLIGAFSFWLIRFIIIYIYSDQIQKNK